MAVVLHTERVFYISTPKVACSSIKAVLFALTAGEERLADLKARGLSIHQIYEDRPNGGPVPAWADDYFSFVVVRDPIERFLSAYGSAVKRSGASTFLTKPPRRLRLPPQPPLDEFVDRFPLYYTLDPRIRWHFAPQAVFVGRGLRDVEHIYWIDELDRLQADLSSFVGTDVAIPHHNPSARPRDLDPEMRERIAQYLADDYELLSSLRPLDGPTAPSRLRRRIDELHTALPTRAIRRLLR